MVRHTILNSLRGYRVKFGAEYGEMVIACDSRNYWRKREFPYYKASRKKHQDKSILDWKQVFGYMDTIKAEVKAFLPYRVIDVDGAEADDVIAALVHWDMGSVLGRSERILILSGDHDFIQLQTDPTVKQYDPIHKKWVTDRDPGKYLFEHVMRGDVGDGIPNVLSDDDTFVDASKKQKPLTQKRIDSIRATFDLKKLVAAASSEFSSGVYANYLRNKRLIDLSLVPPELEARIIESYETQAGKGREKLLPYFMSKNLRNLTQSVSDF
jgi:Kyanoviridae ribonuclease H